MPRKEAQKAFRFLNQNSPTFQVPNSVRAEAPGLVTSPCNLHLAVHSYTLISFVILVDRAASQVCGYSSKLIQTEEEVVGTSDLCDQKHR